MAILDEGKEMCRIRKRRRKKWEITAEIRQCVFWYEHVYFCWWRDASGKKKWSRFGFFSSPDFVSSSKCVRPSFRPLLSGQTVLTEHSLSVRPPVCPSTCLSAGPAPAIAAFISHSASDYWWMSFVTVKKEGFGGLWSFWYFKFFQFINSYCFFFLLSLLLY